MDFILKLFSCCPHCPTKEYELIVTLVLQSTLLLVAYFGAFVIAKDFVNRELLKIKNQSSEKLEMIEKWVILIAGLLIAVALFLLASFGLSTVFASYEYGVKTLPPIYIWSMVLLLSITMLAYVIFIPEHEVARAAKISDKEASVIFKKIARIFSMSALMAVLVLIYSCNAPKSEAFILEQYMLCIGIGLYCVIEIAIYKKVIGSIFSISTAPNYCASEKFVKFVNEKFTSIVFIGITAIILSDYLKYQFQNTDVFSICMVNINIFLCLVFAVQAFSSTIINKFVKYLESLSSCNIEAYVKHRTKNIIFICNFSVAVLYIFIIDYVTVYVGGISQIFDIVDEKIITAVAVIFVTAVINKALVEYKEALLEKYKLKDEKQYQKILTFSPIVYIVASGIIYLISALMILANFGVNITPILTVFGLFSAAIGLAAKDTIQSFLQGVVFLLEKDLYVGEYVDINSGAAVGTIERLSIRVMTVRNPNGCVHIIPYHIISNINNYSKDYAVQIIDLPTYPEFIEKTREILLSIGKQMRSDSIYRIKLLEDVVLLGVRPFDMTCVKIAWSIKTIPDPSKSIVLEFYRRLEIELKAHNIPVPISTTRIVNDSAKSKS